LRNEHVLRVFESRMLRKIIGLTTDVITGYWSRLHTEQLHDFCSSPNIVGVIRSRRVRWAGFVSGTEQNCKQGFGGGKARERDYLEELGVDGRIILGWMF
jgi:hypothetical protein